MREKRRADKFISALPFTVFSGILQFSPADLSKDISIGMFLSLCSNSHCSSSNTACSTQVGSWEDLTLIHLLCVPCWILIILESSLIMLALGSVFWFSNVWKGKTALLLVYDLRDSWLSFGHFYLLGNLNALNSRQFL